MDLDGVFAHETPIVAVGPTGVTSVPNSVHVTFRYLDWESTWDLSDSILTYKIQIGQDWGGTWEHSNQCTVHN